MNNHVDFLLKVFTDLNQYCGVEKQNEYAKQESQLKIYIEMTGSYSNDKKYCLPFMNKLILKQQAMYERAKMDRRNFIGKVQIDIRRRLEIRTAVVESIGATRARRTLVVAQAQGPQH